MNDELGRYKFGYAVMKRLWQEAEADNSCHEDCREEINRLRGILNEAEDIIAALIHGWNVRGESAPTAGKKWVAKNGDLFKDG